MRHVPFLAIALGVWLPVPAAVAAETGLPTSRFVQTWTSLPTGRFMPTPSSRLLETARAHAAPASDARLAALLDDAFASAHDNAERRDVALLEMMAPWDQAKRTAVQHLCEAEAAYAGANEARHERFVATLSRVVDGTGRSAADDGPSSADLDKAYAAVLGKAPGDARVAAQAEQARWRTYSDAFATFADLQTPGSAGGVMAELGRQRVNDLDAAAR